MQIDLFNEPNDEIEIPFYQSTLKSALQKRIRRGETDEALRIAKSMIEQDAHDFARRIMVVVPEESWVHPLMVNMPNIISRLQRKGEKATDTDKSLMLTLVRDASDAITRDFYIKNPDDKPIEPGQLSYISDKEKGLVDALIYRSKIGGMKPDIAMFNSLVNVWVNRFSNKTFSWEDFVSIFPSLTQPIVKWDDIEYAKREDIPFYAVDFHCFKPIAGILLRTAKKDGTPVDNKIVEYINSGVFDGMNVTPRWGDSREVEIVKKTMWLFEVSRNTKLNHWFDEPRAVDWFTDAGFREPVEYQQQLSNLNDIMMQQWERLADWYVGTQLEKHQ